MRSLKIILFTLGAVSSAWAGSTRSKFYGEISDSQCAMNVHSLRRSHEEMITKHTIGTDAASCAKACVRRGGTWVLRSGDDVYRLKNQAGLANFAGQKVEVVGTLESKTTTIENTAIEVTPNSANADH